MKIPLAISSILQTNTVLECKTIFSSWKVLRQHCLFPNFVKSKQVYFKKEVNIKLHRDIFSEVLKFVIRWLFRVFDESHWTAILVHSSIEREVLSYLHSRITNIKPIIYDFYSRNYVFGYCLYGTRGHIYKNMNYVKTYFFRA